MDRCVLVVRMSVLGTMKLFKIVFKDCSFVKGAKKYKEISRKCKNIVFKFWSILEQNEIMLP